MDATQTDHGASGTEVFGAPGLLARLGVVLAEHPIDRARSELSRARRLDLVSGGDP